TPIGLTVDSSGNIFVADSKNNSIRKIDTANNVTTFFATGLNQPNSVTTGDNGDIWVADTLNQEIKVIHTGCLLGLVAGNGSIGPTDGGLDALQAEFASPRAILWSGSNVGLIISDTGNNTVRRLYTNSATGTYTINTVFGSPGQSGLV